ncbi:Frataxin-like domain-containing protein [Neurospora hispaniola]|uniref:ferroxidase n=1 Tax=Neurospora hispaniola TaxID=588809 RepID=A0AAJ0MR04_9PEZI|nr:Frataxin-like domain-containing protein [Neurospora hispaniola]
MSRTGVFKVARASLRSLQGISRNTRITSTPFAAASLLPRATVPRFYSTAGPNGNMITPDKQPVQPKEEAAPTVVRAATELTDDEYHKLADQYMDRLVTHLEELQDEREDIDVEYSAGVLTVSFDDGIGTYVINKQPPNKQIWLSSPKSGPKRYDYVALGDGQNEKEGTAKGEWVYLRDNSTINQLFRDELQIDLSMPVGHYGEEEA